MEYSEAAKLALQEFHKMDENIQIIEAKETDRYFLLWGGSKREFQMSPPALKVDKQTGEVSSFYLPSEEGFKLLRESTEIEI